MRILPVMRTAQCNGTTPPGATLNTPDARRSITDRAARARSEALINCSTGSCPGSGAAIRRENNRAGNDDEPTIRHGLRMASGILLLSWVAASNSNHLH